MSRSPFKNSQHYAHIQYPPTIKHQRNPSLDHRHWNEKHSRRSMRSTLPKAEITGIWARHHLRPSWLGRTAKRPLHLAQGADPDEPRVLLQLLWLRRWFWPKVSTPSRWLASTNSSKHRKRKLTTESSERNLEYNTNTISKELISNPISTTILDNSRWSLKQRKTHRRPKQNHS